MRGGWLSRFLMPMQDACFFDGKLMHEIGKCIFVFIGGTWEDYHDFQIWAHEEENRCLKGRDFHSRLDRIIQISSIDLPPVQAATAVAVASPAGVGAGAGAEGGAGEYPRLFRAMMIRRLLKDVDRVDYHVARFLLEADLFHGMRSLQTIIKASELRRTRAFCVRHLPAHEVLKVHVRDLEPWRNVLAGREPEDLIPVGHWTRHRIKYST